MNEADTIRATLKMDFAPLRVTLDLAGLDALVEALEFYADPVSYENKTPRHVRPVIRDRGAVARAALGGTP